MTETHRGFVPRFAVLEPPAAEFILRSLPRDAMRQAALRARINGRHGLADALDRARWQLEDSAREWLVPQARNFGDRTAEPAADSRGELLDHRVTSAAPPITTRRAAEVLGIGERAVRKMISEKRLPAKRNNNGAWSIDRADVDELLKRRNSR